MTAVTAGTRKTFTAQVDGSAFVVIAPGGAVGSVIDQNGNTQAIDPNGTRRTFGPLNELQSITVSMQIGNASVELNGWSGGIPITAETNASGQTLLDDASRAALDTTPVVSFVERLTRALYPKTAVALAAALSGSADNLFLFSGDSTTTAAGAGSSGQTNLVAARPNGWVSQLAAQMSFAGFNANNDARFGSQTVNATSVTIPQYDTAVTLGGSWSLTGSATYDSIGGGMYTANTSTSTLAIAPAGAFDSVDIYYVQNAGLGTFTVNVDGGATLSTINCASAGLFQKATVSGITLGTHTLNLVMSTSSSVYVAGFVFKNSAKKGLKFVQSGMWGKKIGDFAVTTNLWSPQNALAKLAPTTHFIQLTINDTNLPTNIAAYQASLDAYVKASIAAGIETILMTGWQSSPGGYPNAVLYQQYYDAVKAVAIANNCALIDMGTRMGSYAVTNAMGLMSDGSHPNAIGYADEAALILQILLRSLLGR